MTRTKRQNTTMKTTSNNYSHNNAQKEKKEWDDINRRERKKEIGRGRELHSHCPKQKTQNHLDMNEACSRLTHHKYSSLLNLVVSYL